MKGSKVILCTGGIGSGKSFVMKALSALGVPSFDTDSCAKELYESDKNIVSAIASIAGDEILTDGKVNRRSLAAKIFKDKELLAKVEEIVHPEVLRKFEKWKGSVPSEVVAIESAILLQKPALRGIPDFILYIDAPVEERIARVGRRDILPKEEIIRRINAQQDYSSEADCIIETNDKQAIIPALIEIIDKLKNEEN